MGFIDPVPAGTITIGGKTFGPALPLGRHVHSEHTHPPRISWIHADELRDLIAKADWATPEIHAEVASELEIVKAAHAKLISELFDAREKISDLEKALGWKPKPGRPKKVDKE